MWYRFNLWCGLFLTPLPFGVEGFLYKIIPPHFTIWSPKNIIDRGGITLCLILSQISWISINPGSNPFMLPPSTVSQTSLLLWIRIIRNAPIVMAHPASTDIQNRKRSTILYWQHINPLSSIPQPDTDAGTWSWQLYAEKNFLSAFQWSDHSIWTVADESNMSTAHDHIQTAYDRKSISTFVYQLWSFQLSRARDETGSSACWSR